MEKRLALLPRDSARLITARLPNNRTKNYFKSKGEAGNDLMGSLRLLSKFGSKNTEI